MAQDFDYIERYYGKQFRKGMHVVALGKRGVVTGTESAHVMVHVEGIKHSRPYHPSDVEPASAP